MSTPRKWLLPVFCLALASLACVLINPTPVAWSLTPTPSATPGVLVVRPSDAGAGAQTPTPYASPLVSITTPTSPPPAPTEPRQSPAAAAGLVYLREDGKTLVAALPGRAEPLLIALPAPALQPADLGDGWSPDGEWLALRTGREDLTGWALTLVHLTDGSVESAAPLLPEPPGQPGDLVVDGLRAAGALRWSPDGKALAFIGAADGRSTDLYLFELAGRRVRRLTTGSNQAAAPVWSPDGQWIVHQELREAGQVTALWAASAYYGEMRRLDTPVGGSQAEQLLGWSQPEALIAYSQTADGGRRLREIPLHVRWAYSVYKGPFEVAALDPVSHAVAVIHSQTTGSPNGLTAGLYRFGAYDRPLEPALVEAGEWREVAWWSRPGVFAAGGAQAALTLSLDGEVTLFPGVQHLAPSPDGRWVVIWSDVGGLSLAQPDGKVMQQVSPGPVSALAWLPDSSGVIYQSGDQLYRAVFPLMMPELIESGVVRFAVAGK